MKTFILFIVGFSAVCHASPVAPDSRLSKIAETISNEATTLQNLAKYLDNLREEIASNYREAGSGIEEALKTYSGVIRVKEAMNDASASGKNVEECQTQFDAIFQRTSESLKQSFYDLVDEDLVEKEVSLMEMNGELYMAKEEVEQNMEWHLKQCKKNEHYCDLRHITDNMLEIEATLDVYKRELPHLVSNSIETVQLDILPGKVATEFNEVEKCLKNLQ